MRRFRRLWRICFTLQNPRPPISKRRRSMKFWRRACPFFKPNSKREVSPPNSSGEKGLPRVWIDVHQIQQVLINLMLNAIQAMEKGGTLTLRTFLADEGSVGVEVQDTGIGIPKSRLKKIFDPFFTTKSEGTGLGLSISLKILENHRATIDVESQEGRGRSSRFSFPRPPLVIKEQIKSNAAKAGSEKCPISKLMSHAQRAPANHENKRVSLSRWRERVRVRVERSGFPLTSSCPQSSPPEGRGGIFWGYFRTKEIRYLGIGSDLAFEL